MVFFGTLDGKRKEAGEGGSAAEGEAGEALREGRPQDLRPSVSVGSRAGATGRAVAGGAERPVLSLLRVLEEASASQAGSRKESRLESSGKNKSYDVRIENFDVSFGDR